MTCILKQLSPNDGHDIYDSTVRGRWKSTGLS